MAVAVPLLDPQLAGVVVAETLTAVGWVSVMLVVDVQPLASVTVTVYDPRVNPVTRPLAPGVPAFQL